MPFTVLTDDIEKSPTQNFQKFSNVIIEMIKGSSPNFCIGLYGEWGTGKTTLMKLLYQKLENDFNTNQSIIPIWFNAWMYEREHQFALYPLLQTIATHIPPTNENNKRFKEVLKKIGIGVGKGLIKSTPEIVSSLLPTIVGDPFKKVSTEITKSISDEFILLLDKINEKIINDTLYSTQLNNIKSILDNIREENKIFRIVVFIDDLDRCSPTTTLEVFESIKIFLGLEGFIYILGISNATIIKFLNHQFKDLVNGDQYLRKIIQIPLTLPAWTRKNISKDLIDIIKGKLLSPYDQIIEKHREYISNLMEYNPREIKRLINSFIISREVFTDEIISLSDKTNKEILVVHAMNMRWYNFFPIFSTNSSFRNVVKRYIHDLRIVREHGDLPEKDIIDDIIDEIKSRIENRKNEAEMEVEKLKTFQLNTINQTLTRETETKLIDNQEIELRDRPKLELKRALTANENMLFSFGERDDLWKFIFQNKDVIFEIDNWNLYDRLAKTTASDISNISKQKETSKSASFDDK